MEYDNRLEIFKAQIKNLKGLSVSVEQLKRAINQSIRNKDRVMECELTKLYALIYCAWSEVHFSKLIHTPYALDLSETLAIKKKWKSGPVKCAWYDCVDIGLRKVSKNHKSNFIPNARQYLRRIIDEYIGKPARLRNKIAHGQWKAPLNYEAKAINTELINELHGLDQVKIQNWFYVEEQLGGIIEIMIESPKNKFHRDYMVLTTELTEHINKKCREMTIEKKRQILINKNKDTKKYTTKQKN